MMKKITHIMALTMTLAASTVSGWGEGLTFITHGWDRNPVGSAYDMNVDFPWVEAMSLAISKQQPNWTKTTRPWDSATGSVPLWDSGQALGKAIDEGQKYVAYNYTQLAQFDKIHLIAHSAGTGMIAEISRRLRERGYDGIIQLTYLDAYIPTASQEWRLSQAGYPLGLIAGTGANITEQYYSDESSFLDNGLALGKYVLLTQTEVPGALNRDVTDVNPDDYARMEDENGHGHGYPWFYYQQTIDNPNYNPGWGFALSLEQSVFADLSASVNDRTQLALSPGSGMVSAGRFEWYAGTVSGGGLTNASTEFSIGNRAGREAPSVTSTLENFGKITQPAGVTLTVDNGVIHNHTDATWEMKDYARLVGTGHDSTFNNAGTLEKTGVGMAAAIDSGLSFTNTGTVKVTQGTLAINSGGVNDNGTFVLEPDTRLQLGGAFNFTGSSRIIGWGEVNFTGSINCIGSLHWEPTTIITVSGNGSLNGATHYLNFALTQSTWTFNLKDNGKIINGGYYIQSASTILNYEITDSEPKLIFGGYASLAGTLNILKVSASTGASAILRADGGITGDFNNVTGLSGGGVDYLDVTGRLSDDSREYWVDYSLKWGAGNPDYAGHMTVPDGQEFDLGVGLSTVSAHAGWDGDSLTKNGGGLLTLSGSNTYRGATTINDGTLLVSGLLGGGDYLGDIVNNGALVFAQTTAQTLGGTVSGTGSLTVDSGVVGICQASTYTGITTVSGGALYLGVENAVANSTAIMIDSGAILDLGGFDQNLGALHNDGLVDFVNLGRKLTVHGDLTGSGAFRMDTDIAAGLADTLDVQGTVSGAHELRITNTGAAPTGEEAPLLLVTTQGGDGSFDGTVSAGFYDYAVENGATLGEDTNNWYLNLSGTNADGDVDNGGVDNGGGQAPTVSVAGAVHGSALAVKQSMWFAQQNSLVKRMGDIRLREEAAAPERKLDDKTVATVSDSLLGNVWVRGYGQQLDVSARVVGRSYQQYIYGTDLGTDLRWTLDNNNTLYTGLYAGYGRTDLDYRAADTDGTVNSYYGGLYATWLNHSGWYVDVTVKAASVDHELKDGTASANFDDLNLGGSIELGKKFTFADGWFIEPQAQANYLHNFATAYRAGA
ncbi:MAG: autotransporter outer membrane beta-barrel domain-containing protein, partial [Verrucomicrobiales bacterium]|nr:autotransporter outer membrane beta-barrel domain-containing protein [Verrucomicrobiales bacterium]